MAYGGYNLEADLRAICGMDASLPTTGVLEHWTEMIDAMIEKYQASPNIEIAKMIEANRVSILYWNIRHGAEQNEMNVLIEPLSMDEKEMLSSGNEGRTSWWE